MSHFARIRTQLRERVHLVAALRELHYRFQEGEDLVVRGYQSNRERAEIVVDTGCAYDIGFQRKEDCYEAVADWSFGVEGHSPIRQQEFLRQLTFQYNYSLLREQATEQNLILEEEERLPTGEVVLVWSERG